MRGPHDWGEGQKLQGDAAGQGQEDGEQMDVSPDSAVVAGTGLQSKLKVFLRIISTKQ